MRVAIIGVGEIGKAIAHLLRKQTDVIVSLWDVNADKVPEQSPLADIAATADIVFLCVPSTAIFGATRNVMAHAPASTIFVALTKGIERETCRMTDALLDETLGDRPWALLSGPMLAEEILQDKSAAAIVGTRDKETYGRIAALFAGTSLMLSHSKDVKSVALAGVLKNVYAVALGMVEGLGDGDNLRGMFFTAAIAEMAHIMQHLGTAPDVAYGIAGLGDLVATATSPYSRNRTVGEELAAGRTQRMESEGLGALPCIPRLLADHLDEFPILNGLYMIVSGKEAPTHLMTVLTEQH